MTFGTGATIDQTDVSWGIFNGTYGYGPIQSSFYESNAAKSANAWADSAKKDSQTYQGWYVAAMIALKTAIDLAIAYKQFQTMKDIAAQQYDIANRQLKMAEDLQALWSGTFAPEESKLMGDISSDWNTGRYKPDYIGQRQLSEANTIRAYTKADARLKKQFARYCLGANPSMILELKTDSVRVEIDAVNHQWRREEFTMWQRDETMFNRLLMMFNIGQSLQATATADMAAAAASFIKAGEMKSQASAGWLGALAYGANNLIDHQITNSRLTGISAMQQNALSSSSGLNNVIDGLTGSGSSSPQTSASSVGSPVPANDFLNGYNPESDMSVG
jgi:hypothetical protein